MGASSLPASNFIGAFGAASNLRNRFGGPKEIRMTKGTWARSGARPSTGRGVRPAGSWAASVERARSSFDRLARSAYRGEEFGYSTEAAAAILACAATLWADTAASMGEDGSGEDGEG